MRKNKQKENEAKRTKKGVCGSCLLSVQVKEVKAATEYRRRAKKVLESLGVER
jgi:hypothetical protein